MWFIWIIMIWLIIKINRITKFFGFFTFFCNNKKLKHFLTTPYERQAGATVERGVESANGTARIKHRNQPCHTSDQMWPAMSLPDLKELHINCDGRLKNGNGLAIHIKPNTWGKTRNAKVWEKRLWSNWVNKPCQFWRKRLAWSHQ